jgi:hypothetical protein
VKPVGTEQTRQAGLASQRHSWLKRLTRDRAWLLLLGGEMMQGSQEMSVKMPSASPDNLSTHKAKLGITMMDCCHFVFNPPPNHNQYRVL